jgi:hypothetical protein
MWKDLAADLTTVLTMPAKQADVTDTRKGWFFS